MKINVTLKDRHYKFLDQIVKDFSFSETEQVILSLIKYSFTKGDNDAIFGEMRCIGDCDGVWKDPDEKNTEPGIIIDLEEESVEKLKNIFLEFDFWDYDSENAELSKVIRTMINYAQEDGELKDIFG